MEFGDHNSTTLLTIIIPTFNRKDRLISTLSAIFKQDLSFVKSVIVVDNCSDYDIFKIQDLFSNRKLSIIRNSFNIGMISNVVNTFRYCETDWMWLLSDDDIVEPSSVDTILNSISKFQDSSVIKFLDVYQNKKVECDDVYITSLEAFIKFYGIKGDLGEMIFMSNCIFNIRVLKTCMEKSFRFSYTQVPQVLLLLTALEAGQPVRLINEKIITYQIPSIVNYDTLLDVYLGISTITHVPFKLPDKYKRKLFKLFASDGLRLVFNFLLMNYSYTRLFKVRLIYGNLWKYTMSVPERVAFKVFTCPITILVVKKYPCVPKMVKDIYVSLKHRLS